MVERQEVEALIRKAESCNELGVISGKASTLAALCRAWLAVQDAPEAVVECNDAKGAWLIAADDAPLSEGQRVRLVPVGEEE